MPAPPGFTEAGSGAVYRLPRWNHEENPNLEVEAPEFYYPTGAPSDVRISFESHARRFNGVAERCIPPTREEYGFAISHTFEANRTGKRYVAPPLVDEEGFEDEFQRALKTLNPKGSTGLGSFSKYGTIGDALGWDRGTYRRSDTVDELRRQVQCRLRVLARPLSFHPAESLARTGGSTSRPDAARPKSETEASEESDPIKLFIKDEPHTKKKLEEGRLRLIACLSLVDQMVDRLLFMRWFEYEIDNPLSVTSKAGWSPLPEGYRSLYQQFGEGNSLAVDKSSWDWTMPGWVVNGYVQVKKLQGTEWSQTYENMVWNRLANVVGPRARFNLSDGSVYRQNHWGLMKSGWFLTISMNGMAQQLQHTAAWFRMGRKDKPPYMWAMGDDTLMRSDMNDDEIRFYRESVESLGCIVKLIDRAREFAGYDFKGTEGDAELNPLYPGKHAFNLKYSNPAIVKQLFQAYRCLYSLSSNQWFDKLAEENGVPHLPIYELWAKGIADLELWDDDSIPKI